MDQMRCINAESSDNEDSVRVILRKKLFTDLSVYLNSGPIANLITIQQKKFDQKLFFFLNSIPIEIWFLDFISRIRTAN